MEADAPLERFIRASRKEACMPAKSKSQQMAAGAALSAKRGERSKSSLKGASKQMAQSMSESELKKMASTKRKGKAEHKSKK
jgi:hypothetical protein